MKKPHSFLNKMNPFSIGDHYPPIKYAVEFNDAIQAMEEYSNQFKSIWISVEEKFPGFANQNVLVLTSKKLVKIGNYRVANCYGTVVNNFNIKNVTHWMPLPPIL